MREIKYKAWDTKEKRMFVPFELKQKLNQRLGEFSADIILLQYTGLKDKNGVEIYEGDIVQGSWEPYPIQGVVTYQPPSFIMKFPERKTWSEFIIHYKDPQICEVIGNIYENPELLKENSKNAEKRHCSECGWTGLENETQFGHDDFYCPICLKETLDIYEVKQ